jgi:hypothetical protein
MDFLKEKEEIEAVIPELDPESGITLNSEPELENFNNKNIISEAFKESHRNKNSDLKDIEEEYHKSLFEEINDQSILPKEFDEVIVSLDELIDYLDNSEEYIDV